jgi:hypothetical protein
VILNLSTEDGETTLSNNRVPCYLVKVEVSNEIGRQQLLSIWFERTPSRQRSKPLRKYCLALGERLKPL